MHNADHIILIPDSGPLLELYRNQRLDDLFVSFASLAVPDAVIHELLSKFQDDGKAIAVWVSTNNIPIFDTKTFAHGKGVGVENKSVSPAVVSDLCLQEIMNEINLSLGKTLGVFILDQHKCVGNNTFFSGKHCKTIALKAFEQFLSESRQRQQAPSLPEKRTTRSSRAVDKQASSRAEATSKAAGKGAVKATAKSTANSTAKASGKPVKKSAENEQSGDTTKQVKKPAIKQGGKQVDNQVDTRVDDARAPRNSASEAEPEDGKFFTALEAANPKLMEKRLRELAGQTSELSRKTIDAFKAATRGKAPAPQTPSSKDVEQFRKSLQ